MKSELEKIQNNTSFFLKWGIIMLVITLPFSLGVIIKLFETNRLALTQERPFVFNFCYMISPNVSSISTIISSLLNKNNPSIYTVSNFFGLIFLLGSFMGGAFIKSWNDNSNKLQILKEEIKREKIKNELRQKI